MNPAQHPRRSSFPHRSAMAAGILMMPLYGGAHAEDAAEAAEPAVQLDTIEVVGHKHEAQANPTNNATQLGLSARETPQQVTVIDRETMDDLSLDSLRDLLSVVPGVTVEAIETDRAYFTARGFEITNINIDGVGLPLTYGIYNGDIDTAIYERVTVIRGANGLVNGAGNPSATVDLTRKRPTDRFQASGMASYGSWDTWRAEADVSGPITDGIRGRFVAAQQSGDSYLDFYSKDASVVYGVLDFDLGTDTVLSTGFTWNRYNPNSPMWGALPLSYSDGTATDYPRSKSTSADWAYWDTDTTDAFAELVHRLDNGWSSRLYLTHTRIEADSELFYVYGTPDPVTEEGLTGYASAYNEDEFKDLADLSMRGQFSWLGRKHDLSFGLRWARTDVNELSLYDYTNGFPAIGDFSEWDGDAPLPNFVDGETGSDFKQFERTAYAATRLRLTDAWSVVGGGRLVSWRSNGDAYGEPEDTRETETLPYLGTVYDLNRVWSLYAGYAETFAPQTEQDVHRQHLDPTSGSNLEGGVKAGLLGGRLVVTASVFRSRYDNLAEFAYTYVDPDTGASWSVYAPHDFESTGYELEVTGRPLNNWTLTAGYTHLGVDDENDAAARTYVPRDMVRLFSAYTPSALPKLKLGGTLHWQSSIHNANDSGFEARQASYAVLGAFGRYTLTSHLSLGLNAENLSNEQYLSSLYWGQAYYAAPRNVAGSLHWSF